MKDMILIFVCLLVAGVISAQNITSDTINRPPNNVSLNFLGGASNYSIIYERLLSIKSNRFFPTCIIGIGAGTGDDGGWGPNILQGPSNPKITPLESVTIPHNFSGNIGKGKSFFELGLGGTVVLARDYKYYLPYIITGYRLQPLVSKKVNFRAYINIPLFDLNKVEAGFIPFGFSFGLCF